MWWSTTRPAGLEPRPPSVLRPHSAPGRSPARPMSPTSPSCWPWPTRSSRPSAGLDVLVSNAGTTIDTPPADLDGLDMAGWDRVFAVNVRGMVQVVRACVPMLRQSPIAAIVTTCSIAGVRPGPQPLPYAASKAAAVNLTKTLAGALGPEIRVNGVAPGWIAGEWMEHQLGGNYDRLMERRARLTPLQRVATHDDVAETIVSLALSNPFVTGQVVVVDGGFTSVT